MNTLEDFLIQHEDFARPGSIKRKIARYIGKNNNFTKQELRLIESKAKKIKRSKHKSNRQLNLQLRKFDIASII